MSSEETAATVKRRGRPQGAVSTQTRQIETYLKEEVLSNGSVVPSARIAELIRQRFGSQVMHSYQRARHRIGVKFHRRGFGKGSHLEAYLPVPNQNR